MYIHKYTYICVNIHISRHAALKVYTLYMHVSIRAYVNIHTHVSTQQTCCTEGLYIFYTHIYTCIHTYLCIYKHIHARI